MYTCDNSVNSELLFVNPELLVKSYFLWPYIYYHVALTG